MANPYAEVAAVQALLSTLLIIDEASAPNETTVQLFLDQTASEVDGILIAQGYDTVPATGERDAALIGGFVAMKAAAKTWHAALPGDDSPASVKAWESDYADFIRRLAKGELRLIDQSPASTRSGAIQVGTLTLESWDDVTRC